MKSITTQIFVGLGVIFLLLLCVGIYFFVIDPLNLKPLLFGDMSPKTQQNTAVEKSTNANAPDAQSTGFVLSDAQKSALTSLGIDPAAVPSSITLAQETCFVEALGTVRVSEIKAGAVPNAIELLKAKPCM